MRLAGKILYMCWIPFTWTSRGVQNYPDLQGLQIMFDGSRQAFLRFFRNWFSHHLHYSTRF